MIEGPFLIPDTIVSLAAVVGLVVVIRRIRSTARREGLALDFRAALAVVAAFLILRLLYWHTDLGVFRFGAYASAALIPLMALLLTEGLLRRHAPKWAKILMTAGAIALGALALWPSFTGSDLYTYTLLAFQLGGFLLVAWLVCSRDRDSLSEAENRVVFRIGLSLLIIIPFVVSDHRIAAAPIPVRLSGLAILVLCLLSLSLSRPKIRHRFYVEMLALYLAGCVGAALLLAWQFSLGLGDTMQMSAILLALALVVAIVREDLQIQEEAMQNAVISGFGATEMPSLDAYLGDLAQRGVLESVLILAEADLAEFDQEALVERFRGVSVRSIAELSSDAGNDSLQESQLRALFARYGATHLFEVSRAPLRLAAARQPGFSAEQADRDLSAAFGLARLISERDGLRAILDREGGAPA